MEHPPGGVATDRAISAHCDITKRHFFFSRGTRKRSERWTFKADSILIQAVSAGCRGGQICGATETLEAASGCRTTQHMQNKTNSFSVGFKLPPPRRRLTHTLETHLLQDNYFIGSLQILQLMSNQDTRLLL